MNDEPFLISPEALAMLDESLRELENGYQPKPLDLFAWDMGENEGVTDNGYGT